MNTWLTDVVHDLVYEVYMERFMNLVESIQFITCSWKFMRDSFMNCDKLFRVCNLKLVHGLFKKVYELWWMTA